MKIARSMYSLWVPILTGLVVMLLMSAFLPPASEALTFGQNLSNFIKTEFGPVLTIVLGVIAIILIIKKAYMAFMIFLVFSMLGGAFFLDPDYILNLGKNFFQTIVK